MTTKQKSGHSQRWPNYPFYQKERTLAFLNDEGDIVDENNCIYPGRASEYCDFCRTLITHNLLLFVSSLLDIGKHLDEAICDEHATVICDHKGRPTGIRLKYGNTSRWIVPAERWGGQSSSTFLTEMRTLYEHCKVGVCHSPGSLGDALMRKLIKYKHAAPNAHADKFIRDNMVGGRVDTPGLYRYFPELLEIDMSSAYAAHFMLLPTSTAIAFSGEPRDYFFTWFAQCEVEVPHELSLGPFPVRRPDGQLFYPTLPMLYKTVLWKEQAERSIIEGCRIKVGEGYGWRRSTMDSSLWSEQIHQLRLKAPDDKISKRIKVATVSAIGRHAMGKTGYILVDSKQKKPHDRILCDCDGVYDYYIQESHMDTVAMVHWYAYTLQSCANALYDFEKPYADKGTLVASNYDSVLVYENNPPGIQRFSKEAAICPIGSWRWRRLHHVYVTAPRSFLSVEETVLPGRVR